MNFLFSRLVKTKHIDFLVIIKRLANGTVLFCHVFCFNALRKMELVSCTYFVLAIEMTVFSSALI